MEYQSKSSLRNASQIDLGASRKWPELPLSAAQLGIWFAQELAPSNVDFNGAEYVEIFGAVDPAIFETALRCVAAEADVLSVRFVKYTDGPRQVVGVPPDWSLPFIDVSDEPNPLAAARAWMDADRARPIDLLRGPLFAYALFKVAGDRFYWYARYHHILLDARGRWLIASRLAHVYSALATGLKPDDSTLGSQSVLLEDAAAYRASNDFVSDRQYWLRTLTDLPESTGLSTRPFIVSNGFIRTDSYVPYSTVVQLRAIAPDVSLPRIITAAVAIFVHLMTKEEDLVIGLQVAARVNPATKNVPGMVTNLVPIRVTVHPDMTVSECIRQTAEQIREVLQHQRYRIADLRHDLRRVGDDQPICTPLVNFVPFDYDFTFSGYHSSTHNLSPGPVEDLSIRVYGRSDGDDLLLSFDANPALYDFDALAEHQQRFLRLLAALTDPGIAVGGIDIVASAERRRLLIEWNDTQADYPRDKCIDQVFVTQAERTPSNIAVVFENQSLSYGELNRRANNLARHLWARGVGPDTLVGLYVPRSLDMIIGMLGILKAGGAYLPLDPTYPRDRVAFMLADAQPLLLLTHSTLRGQLAHKSEEMCLDDLPVHMPGGDERPASDKRKAEDLAYVIYTSGSTGKPKGVQITHRSVINFLSAMRREPGINATDTLLAVTTLTFDIAVLELLLPLTSGARVVIAGAEAIADSSRLESMMTRFGVTVMQATPAMWRLLLESGWTGNEQLKILCGGEAWSSVLADELLGRCGSLWNMYGPTETTIWSSTCKVEAGKPVLIGPPIANTTFYVLNALCQPVPVGVPGELHIGGDGLARGYLNRPELTSERFIADPFSRELGARLYKTGDLVRYSPDRKIEFLGRNDRQVKIRGHRIELGEIESVLRLHPAVLDSVVVVREETPSEKKLVAYFQVPDSSSTLVGEVRHLLRQRLPSHMIPSAFVQLNEFPLTLNGKLDRKALPKPEEIRSEKSEWHDEARTRTEVVLLGIWRQLLKLGQIGIYDNFFELGGNSLMVVRLVSQINSTFKVNLGVLDLFQNPTVEQAAKLIVRQHKGNQTPTIFHVHEGKADPPLYFINAGPNEVRLAQLMSGERPVIVIEVPWPLARPNATFNSETSVLPNLEQLVAPYVQAVIDQTGLSPCALAGYSFGGLMGFEIAHQLQRRGGKVEMVMLLDSWLQLPPRYLVILSKLAQNLRCGPIGFLRRFYAMLAPKIQMVGFLSKTIFSSPEDAVLKPIEPTKLDEQGEATWQQLIRVYRNARKSYDPRTLNVRGVLFLPDDDRYIFNRSRGWKNLFSEGLDIVRVNGNHFSMIRDQFHTKFLARKMDEALNRIQASSR